MIFRLYMHETSGNVLGVIPDRVITHIGVIAPGIIGVPLLNSRGELVGIHLHGMRPEESLLSRWPASANGLLCVLRGKPTYPLEFPDNANKTHLEIED